MKLRTSPGWILAGIAALLVVVPALGQQSQLRRTALKNHAPEVSAMLSNLATQYKAKIVLDPALFVATKPTAPAASAALNVALDSLVAQIKHAAWRRIYLQQSAVAVEPAKLAAMVRALEVVDQRGVVLENPSTRNAVMFARDLPADPAMRNLMEAQHFDTAGTYVIYNNDPMAAAFVSAEDQYLDLQKRQMEAMLQMDPDQLKNAMGKSMDLWMNMDPSVRGQMMSQMMQASMQMWNNMPADQKQQLIGEAMKGFGGAGGIPPPPPGQ